MTRREWAVGLSAVLLLIASTAPLAWWEWFGPQRFDTALELGVAPDTGLSDDVGRTEVPRLNEDFGKSQGSELYVEPVVELPPLRLAPTVEVTVVFSVGSSGMTAAEARRLNVADVDDRGSDRLTDSIMLVISDPPSRQAALLSIPRDLWLSHRGHRINESFVRYGAQGFVDDVSKASGLPIHHLVRVNFTAFADLVDAVGGVAVEVTEPMADLYSALYIPGPGCWRLDGSAALAYVRSRHTLTTRDGERWSTSNNASDYARMRRQQALLGAAWDQVRGPGIVGRIPDLLSLARGLTVDDGLGLDDVKRLAGAFSEVAAGRVPAFTLPVLDRRIGRAQVAVIDWSRALRLYERLRSWPPEAGDAGPAGSGPGSAPGADDGPGDGRTTLASPDRDEVAQDGGCHRDWATVAPRDPLRYLAAIANREPVPEYDPSEQPTDGSSEPDGEPTNVDGEPTDPAPTDGSTEDPDPDPSPTPTSCTLLSCDRADA